MSFIGFASTHIRDSFFMIMRFQFVKLPMDIISSALHSYARDKSIAEPHNAHMLTLLCCGDISRK